MVIHLRPGVALPAPGGARRPVPHTASGCSRSLPGAAGAGQGSLRRAGRGCGTEPGQVVGWGTLPAPGWINGTVSAQCSLTMETAYTHPRCHLQLLYIALVVYPSCEVYHHLDNTDHRLCTDLILHQYPALSAARAETPL